LTAFAGRLLAVLTEPHCIHGQLLKVGASIGTHLAGFGEHAAEALHAADRTMYAMKNARGQTPSRMSRH
jgi:GGDEF domain-containing protein